MKPMKSPREIPLFKVFMPPKTALLPAISKILYSGQISEGQPVYDFEKRFGKFVGHQNILSFYSGTAALHTALILAGIRPGDEVVSTPMTAEPTNMAIRHAGASIAWADVDPLSGNVTAQSVQAAITLKTRAILVVHYGGIPVEMKEIYKLARELGIPIIEDAAHALGAKYDKSPIGEGGDYVMYSLQAIKHMTTVDGGMLACKNGSDLERGRRIRWFGIDRKLGRTDVNVREVGYKYHMNNLNAAIGIVQLKYIKGIIEIYKENGNYYQKKLANIPGLECAKPPSNSQPSYWFFTLMAEKRDDLSRYLTEKGIGNSMCHKRNDKHEVFSESTKDLPGVTAFYNKMLHIPCGWWVKKEDRDYIVECLRSGW